MEWIKKNWIFLAVVAAAVLILSVVIILVVPGMGGSEPVVNEVPEGPETGIYYYDTEDGEYILSLNSGNMFTIAGTMLNKTGTYVVTDNGIMLDFLRDEDGTGIIIQDGDVMKLQYKENTMRFIRKTTFSVTFDANGGSPVESVTVMNGKTVAKPADPAKDNNVFLGWYADKACTRLYNFGIDAVTADTTIYAKWAETVVGQNEYIVDFDLGYEAEGFAAMTTIGGKLFNVPTPEREGYTFDGWWISMTEKADELTVPYTDETVFQANTTLFAVWQETTTGPKLPAPSVEVYADSIKWKAIQGATTYTLKITDAQGNVIVEENVGSATRKFNFAEREPGIYTIEVTALSTVQANNSDTTVRTYINKALDRVSLFTVIDGGMLLWNRVEGAEKYRVTIECGNKDHNHTNFDNGDSTTFVFTNCAMQEGGIRFVITAVAEGRADSVSEVFVYDRKLDAVGQILYNEETQTFYWDAVANATNYYVTLVMGEERIVIDNGSATTFSVKHLSGEIKLEVVPVTQGYNSPEAATTTYNKTSLATPTGLAVKGNVLSWNAVDGATGYKLKINNQTFQCTTNSVDVTTLSMTLDSSTVYEISVMAVGAKDSLYSDIVTMKYLAQIESVTYKNNTVTWAPVIGVEKYEIRVNGEVVLQGVEGNSAKIKLTKAGVNLVEVRYTDKGGSDWTGTEVFAYTVIYDSRSLSGIREEYLAMGDTMSMPTDFTNDGYDFAGWYNAPGGASGNGAEITDPHFNGNGSIVLYANWTPKTFYITYVGLTGISNIQEGETVPVVYKSKFQLTVPVADSELGEFIGWFTGPGGSNEALTNAYGTGLGTYELTRDTVAYPAFNNGVLTFIYQADGTYAVTRGPNSSNATTITVPEFYDNVPVTAIMENAFYGLNKVERIRIPATIQTIGVGAIENYAALKEIEVYTETVQQNYEVFFKSHQGALIRYDMGEVYLEIVPMGLTGEFTIPDDVTILRDNAFYKSKLTKVTVGSSVHSIVRHAFYNCPELKTLEFQKGGTANLTIDPEAFYKTTNLTTLRLPARLTDLDLQIINVFTKLSVLEVEPGGSAYSSKDNSIYNALGDAILLSTPSLEGVYEIPRGVREIGSKAFANRSGLTKVIIPNFVTNIAEDAFAGCANIEEIVFSGSRNIDLVIGARAFAGCESVASVTFLGNGKNTLDRGTITIGQGAFEGNRMLRTVTFGSGSNVALIGERAFAGNEKLLTVSYEEGTNVVAIGDSAFAGCKQLEVAIIPVGATSVGSAVFQNCERVREVSFRSSQEEITFGSNVFEGCARLTTIHLPASLSYFDGSVFAGCNSVTDIVVDPANASFVAWDGALYTTGYEELLFYPRMKDGDLTKLHSNTKKIGNKVFQGNPKITEVHIGQNIVAIGDGAFESCLELKKVTFDKNITEMAIGTSAFAKCVLLTTIELPKCTTVVSAYAFEGSGLTSFTIPENAIELGVGALAATHITTIHIPANLEIIRDGAFYNCEKLTSITFASGTKALSLGTLTNEGYGVFQGTQIESLVMGDRVTVIGANAFRLVKTLKSLTMGPDCQVTDIGNGAFYGNAKLKSLTLGPRVREIGANAFNGATLRNKLVIPNSVEVIRDSAFRNTALSSIYFEPGGTEPLRIKGNSVFVGGQIKEITFPARAVEIYSIIDWSGISIKSFKNNFGGNITTINFEEGSEYFKIIDGVLYELNANGEPEILLWCPKSKTGELVIPKEVRKVENGAFTKTGLSKISFEEYPEDHELYGQPLLSLGTESNTRVTGSALMDTGYPVFSGENLVSITLPSHLKVVGLAAFNALLNEDITINFNQAAKIEFVSGSAFMASVIEEIELPAVVGFGPAIFDKCAELEVVSFHQDSSFTSLPSGMFSGCTRLQKITIPDSVAVIEDSVFAGCTLLNTVVFGENSKLQAIHDYAFQKANFREFTMPKNLVSLGMGVFDGCTMLRKITLSDKITVVYADTFSSCSALSEVIVPQSNPYLKSIDGVVYDYAETILYFFPRQKSATGFTLPDTLITIEAKSMQYFKGQELTLPETLEQIGDYAFSGASLRKIHIPKNVTKIGNNAFRCNLAELTFAPDSKLTTIGDYAFNSQKISELNLPDNVNYIGEYAFAKCLNLEEVILPAGLKGMGNGVLQGCSNLKKVTLQEGLESIPAWTFSGTKITEIVIPASVKTLGQNCLIGADLLKSVTFAPGSRLETLGTYAFNDCTAIEYIKLPESLRTISTSTSVYYVNGVEYVKNVAGTFDGCVNLKTLDMSACKYLEVLPTYVITGCTNLETLLLPPNLVRIDDFAFGDPLGLMRRYSSDACPAPLTSLKEITIPASVTSIGGYVFYGFTSLETVIFEAGSGVTKLGDELIPADKPYWGQNIFANTPALKTVVLPEDLTAIGPHCFENSTVENITLPGTIRTICDSAFKNCDNITVVDFTSSLIHVGAEAFFDCDKLEKADLVEGVQYLGVGAFGCCEQLKHANIPATVSSMYGNPFLGCSGLESYTVDAANDNFKVDANGVIYDKDMYAILYYPATLTAETFELPESVQEITPGAFSGAQFKSLQIPSRITQIADYAFQNSALETVVFHKGITSIGDHAFDGCSNLNNVVIPNSVLYAGHYAFANCSSLGNVSFEDKVTGTAPYTIGTHFFDGCTALTQVVLPNMWTLTDEEVAEWDRLEDRTAAIPGYMFAHTGIVHAVIPAVVTDLVTPGVFEGCEKLESITFEAEKMDTNSLGVRFFYGCSSLKEVSVPTGVYEICEYYPEIPAETFAGCTSLERVMFDLTGATINAGVRMFYNCSNLTEIKLSAKSTSKGFYDIYEDAFAGCAKLKEVPIYSTVYIYGSPFAGSGIETLTLQLKAEAGSIFAGATQLKEVYIKKSALSLHADTFANLSTEINFYFFEQTRAQVISACGEEWLQNADEKAHFYFKDTMPE